MTATQKQNSTTKLERAVGGIQQRLTTVDTRVRMLAESVAEIGDTVDAIYDAVSYHQDASQGPDYLNALD
jgi:hypothetical protein